jgi:hypothetical protein
VACSRVNFATLLLKIRQTFRTRKVIFQTT